MVLSSVIISLTIKEQFIINRLLSEQIEKSIGISPPQETYIQNIDSGMTEQEASQQFIIDNKQYLRYMQTVEKNPLFILLDKIDMKTNT